MLTVVTSVRPSITIGALRAWLMRPAASFTCSVVLTPFRITMNSSPPMRTTTSSARMVARMRCATVFRSLSPVSWPRESLTCLKRSRSRNSTASTVVVFLASSMASRQVQLQVQAVRQPGQLVVVREVIELLVLLEQVRLDLAAHGHVVHRHGERRAVAEAQAGSRSLPRCAASRPCSAGAFPPARGCSLPGSSSGAPGSRPPRR